MRTDRRMLLAVFIFALLFFIPIGAKAQSKNEPFIKGFYTNIFQRDADISEIEYWQNQIKEGMNATDIALFFYKSKEMQEANLSSEEFVKRAYLTFFDRVAKSEGLEYWKNRLDNDGYSKEQIFYHFSFSKEFQKRSVKYGVVPFDQDNKLKAFISRFYSLILQRDSDDEGMNFWFEKLKSKKSTPNDIAEFFFFSDEMKAKNLSDEDFVKIAYRVFFDREADSEGLSFWSQKIDEKGKKWVIEAMMESEEFSKITAELFDENKFAFPPSPPSNLKYSIKDSMVELDWESITDAVSYRLYKAVDSNKSEDAKMIYEGTDTSFTDTDTANGEFYTYFATSVDSSAKESAFSDGIEVELSKTRIGRIILKSGQTESFITYDDGYYQKGADIDYTRDDATGIVTDHTTSLMWQDNVKDGGESLVQSEAESYCENLVLGGYSDWRLPSVEELENSASYKYETNWRYTISTVFKNIDSWKFWTSTKYTLDPNSHWVICFGQGFSHVYNNSEVFHARCVRGKDQHLTEPVLKRDDQKEVVTEDATKLMWQDNSAARSYSATWEGAVNYCENLTFAGYDDWRLPNEKELYFIADRTKSYPAVYNGFKNTATGFYWTSTTYQRTTDEAWRVGFGVGRLEHSKKSETAYIRCIRDIE